MPEKVQKRIKSKLQFFENLDDPLKFAKKLRGFEPATHRFRVGDYRIICCIEGKELVVLVLKVGHRREVYE